MVAITTVVWLAMTFLIAPESRETLVAFYGVLPHPVPDWAPDRESRTRGQAASGWHVKPARLDLWLYPQLRTLYLVSASCCISRHRGRTHRPCRRLLGPDTPTAGVRLSARPTGTHIMTA